MLLGPANGWVRETWQMGKRAMESESRHKCVTQEREFMSTTRPVEMSPLKLSRQSTRGTNSKFGLRLLGKRAACALANNEAWFCAMVQLEARVLAGEPAHPSPDRGHSHFGNEPPVPHLDFPVKEKNCG